MVTQIFVQGNAVRSQKVGGANITSPGPLLQVEDETEVPWTDVNGYPQGWGTTFHAKSRVEPASFNDLWFHFPMPTLVLFENKRVELQRVHILFETTRHGHSKQVDVWYGRTRIFTRPNLNFPPGAPTELPGPQNLGSTLIEGQNSFTLPTNTQGLFPTITFALGISILIRFFDGDGSVTFFGAGADFI